MRRSNIGLIVSVLVAADACATDTPANEHPPAASTPGAGANDLGDALAGRFAFTIDGMKRVNGAL